MWCALLLLVCAFAFLSDASNIEKRSALLPNANDVLTTVCNGVPCTIPSYVYNTQNGKVIPQPSLCIVFWGTVSDKVKTEIADFVVSVFQNSNYTDGWSEYGLQHRPTLHPACGRGVSLTANPGSDMTDIAAQIRASVGNGLPPVTLNTHYVNFVGAQNNDCSTTCGYHGWGNGAIEQLSFSYIPDYSPSNPACSVCIGSNVVLADNDQLDWFEATKAQFSRILADAVTNPFGDAWMDPQVEDGQGQIGDLCYDFSGRYQDVIFGNVVQKWYSQQAKACVTSHLDYVAEAIACGTYDPVTLEPLSWTHHPYDCTDSYNHARCMYCKGWANGKIVKQCLPRLGAACNPTFNTAPRVAFCNLEFECSGSLLGMNVVALVSAMLLLVALFF